MGSPQNGVAAALVVVAVGPIRLLDASAGAGHVLPLVAGCTARFLALVSFLLVLLVEDVVSRKRRRLETQFAAGSREGQ